MKGPSPKTRYDRRSGLGHGREEEVSRSDDVGATNRGLLATALLRVSSRNDIEPAGACFAGTRFFQTPPNNQ